MAVSATSADSPDLPSKTVELAKQAIGVIISLVLFAALFQVVDGSQAPFIAEGIAGTVSIVAVVATRSVLVDGPMRRQRQSSDLPPEPSAP